MPNVCCQYLAVILLSAVAPVLPAAEFAQCLGQLRQQATAAGVSQATVEQALGSAVFRPEIIKLDRQQPEFHEPFADYLNKRVTETRIARGQALLAKHRHLLNRLTKKYGVPQHTLLALWGLETHYGGYLGTLPVIDSLVTLACDKRRSTYFAQEVIAALQLMEKHHLSRDQMLGSWAGAMGHTQFMPSNYLRYGISHNNSPTVNLWHSIPDALTSAAYFLQTLGWQRHWKWGREVRLPKGFDYQQTGLQNKQPLAVWRQLGITTAFGGALPKASDATAKAALIIPAGYQGPVFLVYDNFQVLRQWNRSSYYALSVGYLADRINGASKLQQVPPDEPRLNATRIAALQKKLNALGFNSGKADGVIGPTTQQAIRAFQQAKAMIADGHPRIAVFKALNIAAQ